jgi:creatinine amidohydrolase
MLLLADATWTEVAELLGHRPETLCLVPVGAIEAHGPHLPLATDVVIAQGLCRRAAAALEGAGRSVAVAPAIVYSVTDYAGGFPGTIGVPSDVAAASARAVVTGLMRAGFPRVLLANAHLEPAHLASLRAALSGLSGAVLADCTERRFARTLTEEFKRGACHAGSYETSLLLAEQPSLVRDERRAALAPLPIDLARAMREGITTFQAAGAPDAYFGDPASATPAEGEWIFARLVEMVLTLVAETWP